jgi:large subunit ribosomal protein L17
MRHRKRGRKLGRTAAHRQALRRNLAKAILEHERIVTTPAKAKEARRFVERLINIAKLAQPFKDKEDLRERAKYLHYYRLALSKLQDKKLVQKLFGEGQWRKEESLAVRYAGREGGFTRIIRLSGSRLGMAIGSTLSEIPVLTYKMAGRERTLRLIGRRLGDDAPQVIFELVEKARAEEEVAPKVSLSEKAKKEAEDEGKEEPKAESKGKKKE